MVSTVDEKSLPAQDKNLFPTKNILGIETPDRFTTSFWLDRSIVDSFKDACHISGRKTCDIIEPMMEAYVRIVKNKVLKKGFSCPFKTVEVTIKNLTIQQKYAKRGPRSGGSNGYVHRCPFDNHKILSIKDKGFCLYSCKNGGKWSRISKRPDLYPLFIEMGKCEVHSKLIG